jgi:uncharacterized protein HemY
MVNITQSIQQGKGSAISRLEELAHKYERQGDHERAETFRRNAQTLKQQSPTIWG